MEIEIEIGTEKEIGTEIENDRMRRLGWEDEKETITHIFQKLDFTRRKTKWIGPRFSDLNHIQVRSRV